MKKNYELKKEIKSIRWLLFGVMLSLFATEVLFQAVSSFMSNPPNDYIRMTVVELAALAVPFMLYGRVLQGRLNKKYLHLNALSFGKTAWIFFLGFTGQFVIILLNFPLEYVYQTFISGKEASAESVSTAGFFMALVSVGLIPAFLEELLMRGVVFRAFDQISTNAGIWFTVFVFVVFHGKPECIFGYAFMGYMTVFVMRRCDSLYAAMVYHFSSNIAAVIFGMTAVRLVPVIWLVIIAMTVMFALLFVGFYIKYAPEKKTVCRSDINVFLRSVFSLPILLSILIVAIKYWLLNLR